jgi:hypothetical protein
MRLSFPNPDSRCHNLASAFRIQFIHNVSQSLIHIYECVKFDVYYMAFVMGSSTQIDACLYHCLLTKHFDTIEIETKLLEL